MARIIVCCWSKKMRNDKENPKNYPYWKELVKLLRDNGHIVTQMGMIGEEDVGADKFLKNMSFIFMKPIILEADTFICVDNYFHHFAHTIGKKGFVIWAITDPLLFGYPEHTNILKDRKYLRPNQFDIFENTEFNKEVFMSAEDVYKIIKEGI